jgi:hypothetical protein
MVIVRASRHGRCECLCSWLHDGSALCCSACRPESVIAVVSHCGFLVHGMRALGKSMLNTWSNTMVAQVNAYSSTAPAAIHPPSSLFSSTPAPSALPAAQGMPFAAASSTSTGPCPVYPAPSQQLAASARQPQVSTGGGADVPATTAAEVLRQSAIALTGWMSADWLNCECRSIQLGWGDAVQLLSGPAAAPAGSSGDGDGIGAAGEGKFLWAQPGECTTWFPGGFFGIVQ